MIIDLGHLSKFVEAFIISYRCRNRRDDDCQNIATILTLCFQMKVLFIRSIIVVNDKMDQITINGPINEMCALSHFHPDQIR